MHSRSVQRTTCVAEGLGREMSLRQSVSRGTSLAAAEVRLRAGDRDSVRSCAERALGCPEVAKWARLAVEAPGTVKMLDQLLLPGEANSREARR